MSTVAQATKECEPVSNFNEDTTYPIEYNIYALCLRQDGAVKYFNDNLPSELVGIPTGNTGLHELYLAFLDFYNHTGLDRVDPIAFQAWLIDEGKTFIETLGGEGVVIQYLELFNDIPLSNPESVVAILKHQSNKRKQMNVLQELQLLVNKKEVKTNVDRDRLSQLTEQIRSLESEIGYDPLASVTTATDIATRTDDIWDIPDFIQTPFPSLNRVLGYSESGGLIRGAISVIVAPSGAGKSTLAKCFMNHWAEQGYTTLFINFEEAQTHWERILMSQITGKNVYIGATDEEKIYYNKIFQERLAKWGDKFMVRHDPDTSYFDDLELWLRDIIGHNERVPDVVVIDTIQSMQIKAGGKPRWGEYEQMMIRLEKLAKDMNCALVLTAQENSNRVKEKREVVEQSDVGGSLTIVQKSTVTMVLTKKHLLAGHDAEDESIVQIQIAKNRITGTAFINDPPLLKYNDTIKSFEEYIPAHVPEFNDWETEKREI